MLQSQTSKSVKANCLPVFCTKAKFMDEIVLGLMKGRRKDKAGERQDLHTKEEAKIRKSLGVDSYRM